MTTKKPRAWHETRHSGGVVCGAKGSVNTAAAHLVTCGRCLRIRRHHESVRQRLAELEKPAAMMKDLPDEIWINHYGGAMVNTIFLSENAARYLTLSGCVTARYVLARKERP